jgi:phospholipase C
VVRVKRNPPPSSQSASGTPSSIKHVRFLLIENRTYDQKLYGDMKQGNGDPSSPSSGA